MKVCYFIQAHKNPKQVYRLVRTIKKSSPNSLIVIGYDFTNSSISMEFLQNLSEVYLLRSNYSVKRGDLSVLQPYFNCINWLYNNNFNFDWLAYISGQDYPVQSLSDIENLLSKTEYDAFIEFYDVLSEQSHWSKDEALHRYFKQYFTFPKWMRRIIVRTSKFLKTLPLELDFNYEVKVGIAAKKNPFSQNFICYGGNHRHFLSKKCVKYLKEFIDANSNLVKYYKKTILPEESLVQTILVNSNKFNLCNHYKIYNDYSECASNNGSPKSLTIEDYPKLITREFFFARKFEQESEVLNMLDAIIFSNQEAMK